MLLCFSCKQGGGGDEQTQSSRDSLSSSGEMERLNQLILKEPNNAHAYYLRSRLFMQRTIMQQAINDAVKAVELDTTRVDYYLHLADLSFRGLLINKAISNYEIALQRDPKNVEANMKLAELYLYLKTYPKAVQYCDAVIQLDDKYTKAYFIKGFVFKETGDTARALSSFQTVVDIEPAYYDAHIQLGIINAARKNKIAQQYYNNALRIRPTSVEALYNRGLFYQQSGQLEKAEEDYNQILKLNPAYEDAYYNLGFIALVFKEDYPAAIQQFTYALNINQNYVEAYYNRGLAQEFSGNKEAAMADYRKALNIYPTYKLAQERMKGLEK